jgi:hypothetical protein
MTTEIKFAAAIELTQEFVLQLGAGQLSPQQITSLVANLVATQEGARGFFVGYLTSSEPIVDKIHPSVLAGLAAHPSLVADLLVKNLAMSTAQSLHFQRQSQPEMTANSQTVAKRSQQLIEQLHWPELIDRCQKLEQSAKDGSGEYAEFLARWGYDQEQKQAIQRILGEIRPVPQ